MKNYDYYRVFYYVAKYKSFTAAARELLNNQPNISRMIKKLEEELGCTLFVRHNLGISLTPEGEKLYEHVSVAFDHILLGEQEIARNKGLESGIVIIAASEIALHCALLPVLKRFKKSYPGIRIKISHHSTPQAIDALKKGLVDFAIVTDPFEIPSGIHSKILRKIQEVPICSSGLLLSSSNTISKEDFHQYPLIGLGVNTSSFSFYANYFNENGMTYSPDIEVATADQIIPMVKSGLGIGFVPRDFLKEEKNKNLIILKPKPPVPSRNICLLKRKDTVLSIAADELVKELNKLDNLDISK